MIPNSPLLPGNHQLPGGGGWQVQGAGGAAGQQVRGVVQSEGVRHGAGRHRARIPAGLPWRPGLQAARQEGQVPSRLQADGGRRGGVQVAAEIYLAVSTISTLSIQTGAQVRGQGDQAQRGP